MSNSNGKFSLFLKKNLAYIIVTLCIIAIGLSVTLVLVNKNNNNLNLGNDTPVIDEPIEIPTDKPGDVIDTPTDTPVDPPVDIPVDKPDDSTEPVIKVITFIMPVANADSVGSYEETPVFNPTLEKNVVHKAIDFYAPEGTNVYACYEGEIESVTTTFLNGTTVTINHGDGLKTIYNSLGSEVPVTVGQKVSQGDIIGTVSESNLEEFMSGAHLHFSVEENGIIINPDKYLAMGDK